MWRGSFAPASCFANAVEWGLAAGDDPAERGDMVVEHLAAGAGQAGPGTLTAIQRALRKEMNAASDSDCGGKLPLPLWERERARERQRVGRVRGTLGRYRS